MVKVHESSDTNYVNFIIIFYGTHFHNALLIPCDKKMNIWMPRAVLTSSNIITNVGHIKGEKIQY